MGDLSLDVVWITILSVASAIVLLSNAAEKIVKAVKAAKAPNIRQDERLEALETWRKDVDRKLARETDHMSAIDVGNRVTQRALLALLDHGIDGNNYEQMRHAKEELQEHLISR